MKERVKKEGAGKRKEKLVSGSSRKQSAELKELPRGNQHAPRQLDLLQSAINLLRAERVRAQRTALEI